MPRKDGKPTAKELRDEQRHADNARWLREHCTDDHLRELLHDRSSVLDEVTTAQVHAEAERRGITLQQ